MSAFHTEDISREKAEEMVLACRAKKQNPLMNMTNRELNEELHEYVYSENYQEIVGVLTNYLIKDGV